MNPIRKAADFFFIIYKDDSIEEKGRKVAFYITFAVWICLCAGMIFLPEKTEKKDFEEIRITLAPEEKKLQEFEKPSSFAEKSQTASEKVPLQSSAKEPAKVSPEKENVLQEKIMQTAQKPSKPAPSAVQKTEKPAEPARKYTISKPRTYAKSTEQLLSEQLASAKSEKQWNDEAFSDGENTVTSKTASVSSDNVKKLTSEESFRGEAASAAEESSQVMAESSTARTGSDSSSDSVKNSLETIGQIKPVSYSGSANGIATASHVQSANGTSGVSMLMQNGKMRRLLEPSKPVIVISEENAHLIQNSYNLQIKFKVLPGGNVLLSGIVFSATGLPAPVQAEIKEQISKWRFEQDTSEGTAVFDFSIVRK
ncbi:MAG: hypothetical protein PUK76_11955 [Treponema sp.]|nr:hypothetical protein [Treponema sp.]